MSEELQKPEAGDDMPPAAHTHSEQIEPMPDTSAPLPRQSSDKDGDGPRGEALRMDLYFWLQALVMALVGLILIFTFVGRIIGVDGSSMVPTLHDHDMLLLQSIGYRPAQGDVVVVRKESFRDGSPIVKRVIAVGGQTVDIDYASNTVYVDGVAMDEPYILEPMWQLPPHFATHIEVPEGSIFVMGDNRNNSTDSRSPELGVVDERCVLGRALAILFPLQDFGAIESISRPLEQAELP